MKVIFRILLILFTFSIGMSYSFAKAIRSDKHSITYLVGMGTRKDITDILRNVKLYKPYGYSIGAGYKSPGIYSGPIMLNLELFKYFGHHHSFELTFYPNIETRPLNLGKYSFSWAIGDGISYMFGPFPKFEQTKNKRTKRLLNFFILEQNIFLRDNPETKITFRWHHRCNFFRHMGPAGAGANFFAIGVRHSF